MQIRLHLFAGLAESMGSPTLELELPASTYSVKDLKERLASLYPAAGPALLQALVSVDQKFATNDSTLSEGSEVALLPPVSGG
ncbi:MoaD/ThiS family protein, partial [Gorillibacterium massiliense]|uniref:MoaD/ThiS family protein n=1 Tax=Gorillibacterium massiliense TaxID=1280390 RepID=UPI0004B18BF5